MATNQSAAAVDQDAIHILTPDRQPIRGLIEHIPACALIGDLRIAGDGSLDFDTEGYDVEWPEDARPVEAPHPDTQRNGRVFIDFVGIEHHEDDLIRCIPEARVVGCPWCAPNSGP